MHGFVTQYADGVFDPETVRILTDAFDDAWARVQESNGPYAGEEYALADRTILAKRIITLAKEGQLDRRRLTVAALVYLARQKLGKTTPNGSS
jgi:hypothetical protein